MEITLTTEDMDRCRRIVRWYRQTHAHRSDADDLEGAAMEGLFQASQRFRPEEGAHFWPFATTRIIGAMRDELRKTDHLTRDQRNSSYRESDGRLVTVIDGRLFDATEPLPLDAILSNDDEEGGTAHSLLGRRDAGYLIVELWDWWRRLDERTRYLVIARDLIGISAVDLATELEITQGRVSQLISAAYATMG